MSSRVRTAVWAGLLVALAVVLVGCGGATSPADEPKKYAQLVRVAAAEVRAEEDTTRLWMRNSENAKIRDLMLSLKLDYLRYDARRGVVCAWAGGGMMPARGFVYRLPPRARLAAGADTTASGSTALDSTASVSGSPPPDRVPPDSLGDACYRTGPCTEASVTSDWTRFQCP